MLENYNHTKKHCYCFFLVVGPYMVLDYCINGQLRDWLLQQKNAVTEDTVEWLHRITYGVSKGMYYLETKKVTYLCHEVLDLESVMYSSKLQKLCNSKIIEVLRY